VKVIRRGDYSSLYGDEVFFSGDVRVIDAEFVRVQCYAANGSKPLYTNFHAVARLKPDVERRCDEALDQRRRGQGGRRDDVPNVLMIGIDSTSRLNSIRRLNSTRSFLLQELQVN